MALRSGTRLGSYEILSAIGAGSMGEVFRARDARLNRDVALKILPAAFATDVDRRGATWSNGTPMTLLERPYYIGGPAGRTYDVSPDGRRFLMIKTSGTDASAAPPALIVVQHWDEELKRLVPTTR